MSQNTKPPDKRIAPRTAIELKVEYRRLNTFFADYTKNISRGGTFIKTPKPLGVGTDFLFKLSIPTLNEPIVLTGQVLWVVKPEDVGPGEHPGMGIKFKYSSKEEQDAIEGLVERLMIDSLGRHLYEKLLHRSSVPPDLKNDTEGHED
ncbi:MAG: TIGR02266 family protein [Myxococcota bacterium]|jgi:type IV pilus assembly protein PilZ|nr:TIGR02266 family protein [Myxococcota bacterium]